MEALIGAFALLVGLGVGWLVATRASGSEELRRERDAARADAEGNAAKATAEREQRTSAETAFRETIAGLKSDLNAAQKHEEQLRNAMESVSGTVLEKTTKQLRAEFDEQRKRDRESATTELDRRTEKIEALVKPVGDKLKAFDAKVQQAEKARSTLDGSFLKQLETLGLRVEDLGKRTGSLVDALRKPNVRGAWGELQLRSVIERAGMNAYCDFTEQTTVTDGDGRRLRPDVLVRLPGDKLIVIDAKVPLDAFLAAQEAETEETIAVAMARHARQVREHIKTLATKRYQDQFDNTADLVVMFLPNEGIYHGALDADRDLFDYAVDQSVLIATPTTLVALLRAVNYGWTQERIAVNARDIAQAGTELHKRLVSFVEHFTGVGKSLNTAVSKYNAAVGSFDGRVLPQVKRLEELDAKSAKVLPEPAGVEETAREVRATSGLGAGADDV
ncbi:DNA recombination protein RmuC [Patulibacter sp. NPDC049589]|uniref:DNA recombination protein RmuC n=1 Tax=Patulibacter sp. NPDC049589 TaxID=3154731 RepID=UPI003433762D